MLRWLLVLLAMWSIACGHRAVNKPTVPKDTMVAILLDIHLLEAEYQAVPQNKARIYNTIVNYEKIFRKHGVSDRDFYDTFSYYRDRPDTLDEMYQRVIDAATRRESEIAPEAAKERMQRGGVADTVRRRRSVLQHGEW